MMMMMMMMRWMMMMSMDEYNPSSLVKEQNEAVGGGASQGVLAKNWLWCNLSVPANHKAEVVKEPPHG